MIVPNYDELDNEPLVPMPTERFSISLARYYTFLLAPITRTHKHTPWTRPHTHFIQLRIYVQLTW